MTISYVGSSNVTGATSGTTLAPAMPAGVQVGDVAFIWIFQHNISRNFTATATGWTQVGTNAGTAYRGRLLRRVLDGTEGASVTVTFSSTIGADGCFANISAFRGADNITPEDTTAVGDENNAAANWTPDPITTTDANSWVLSFAAARNDVNINITAVPNGYTLRFSLNTTTGSDACLGMASKPIASPGVTTGPTWNQSGGTDNWVGVMYALKEQPPTVNLTPALVGRGLMETALSLDNAILLSSSMAGVGRMSTALKVSRRRIVKPPKLITVRNRLGEKVSLID